ncbi:MAG: U32 family peptidase [Bacilli bacterium]|nr:U32 family peptidase [Bacillales bacterium]MDY2575025.1 U32 family peptidase [Bacilli bacterium]
MRNKIELLAPAGDLEKLKIDVLYGADAVYIGGKLFSLRSASNNFTLEEMKEGIEFAHQRKCKVYVALNVYPNDEDKDLLDQYLLDLDSLNVDAIIVSSLYIMKRAKELGCKFELHVSTQESTSNNLMIDFYKSMGATRVVLARECTLEQIKDITSKSSLEVEVFIHGAMCCSYSGRCTLSNYYTQRDANKGSCSHPCRWDYDLYKNNKLLKNKFLLGSKDLMSVSFIKSLIESGVSSLKIEGRMKSISYLAHVCKTYRKLIDDIYENKIEPLTNYIKEVEESGNRQTTSGWLKGYTDHLDLIYTFSNTPLQNYLGMIIDYDENTHLASITMKNPINKNEEIELVSFDRGNTSFIVNRIIDAKGNEVESANNTFFTYQIEIPFKVKKYEILRKKVNLTD